MLRKFPFIASPYVAAIIRPVLPFFLGAVFALNIQHHNQFMAALLAVCWALNVYTSWRLDFSMLRLLHAVTAAGRFNMELVANLTGILQGVIGVRIGVVATGRNYETD